MFVVGRARKGEDMTCMQQSWCFTCNLRLPMSQLHCGVMLPHPELPTPGITEVLPHLSGLSGMVEFRMLERWC